MMPPLSDSHDAHDYAERLRARLPRRLQELREKVGMSKYGLARESGLSREYIGKLERGIANPTLPVTAARSGVCQGKCGDAHMTLAPWLAIEQDSSGLRNAVAVARGGSLSGGSVRGPAV